MPSMRFVPTDEELIVDFLKPYVLSGRPLRCDAIRATDVYAKNPWELVGEREDEAYFITRRSRTTKGSSRPQRTVPSGTWKMEKRVDVTDESGAVIGCKAHLSFHFGKKRKASGWVMHEFLLGSVADDDKGIAFQETALCRIKGKRGRRQGGATAKRIKNSLEDQEQFLEVGSSLMHGSESEMMVLSPQSVLQCSPPSSMLVQSPQQEEDEDDDDVDVDVDVAPPPWASNPNCEDGGGGDHKVSALVGGFTDLLLGTYDDGDHQLAIDFNQMTTAEQWDMFCNFGTCLEVEGSTWTAMPTACDQSAAAVSVGESTTIDWPEIDADRATTSELPTIVSEMTTSTNEGSTELVVDPDFRLWDLDLEDITEPVAPAPSNISVKAGGMPNNTTSTAATTVVKVCDNRSMTMETNNTMAVGSEQSSMSGVFDQDEELNFDFSNAFADWSLEDIQRELSCILFDDSHETEMFEDFTFI